MLGEADADERVEGVEHLTRTGTAGLRRQGELEHRRVAVVPDLDGAERGTDVVHALLALAGAGDAQARRSPATPDAAASSTASGTGRPTTVDGRDPVLDFGDRFLQGGRALDRRTAPVAGMPSGKRRGEALGEGSRGRRLR